MRKLILSLCLLATGGMYAQNDALIPYRKGEKWGFSDADKKIVIPCKYSDVDFFNARGLAFVSQKNKWGVINNKGEQIIPCEYEALGYFSPKGIAKAQKKKKWGLINDQGKEVVGFDYDYIGDFAEGVARFRKGKTWGVLAADGKEIVKAKFDSLGTVAQKGRIAALDKGKWGTISLTGQTLIAPSYDSWEEWSKVSLVAAKKGTKWDLLDAAGKTIVTGLDSTYLLDKKIAIQRQGKIGIIDMTGKELIPCLYQELETVSGEDIHAPMVETGEGPYYDSKIYPLYRVKKDFLYGYIHSETGKEVVAPIYDDAPSWVNGGGFAVVEIAGKKGLISMEGKEIIPVKYADVYSENLKYYMARMGDQSEKVALYDTVGKVIIPAEKYGNVSPIDYGGYGQPTRGYFRVSEYSGYGEYIRYGLVDSLNKELLPIEYQDIYLDTYPMVRLRKDDKDYFFNLETKKIVSDGDYQASSTLIGDFISVQKEGGWQVQNVKTGKIYPEKYEELYMLDTLSFYGRSGDNITVYDLKGNIVLKEIKAESITGFGRGDRFTIHQEGVDMLLNAKNERLTKKDYLSIYPMYEEGLENFLQVSIRISEEEKILENPSEDEYIDLNVVNGIIDYDGKEILPCEFTSIGDVSDGLIRVKKVRQIGLYTLKGKEIIPAIYDAIWREGDDMFWVEKNGKRGLISKSGKKYFED